MYVVDVQKPTEAVGHLDETNPGVGGNIGADVEALRAAARIAAGVENSPGQGRPGGTAIHRHLGVYPISRSQSAVVAEGQSRGSRATQVRFAIDVLGVRPRSFNA